MSRVGSAISWIQGCRWTRYTCISDPGFKRFKICRIIRHCVSLCRLYNLVRAHGSSNIYALIKLEWKLGRPAQPPHASRAAMHGWGEGWGTFPWERDVDITPPQNQKRRTPGTRAVVWYVDSSHTPHNFPSKVSPKENGKNDEKPLNSLIIGEIIFAVLNIEKKIVIVRFRHFWRQDIVFLLCCGMHYLLRTPGKRFFPSQTTSAQGINGLLLWRLSNERQGSVLKSVATTLSPISSCKSASFLRWFICYTARKPARWPLHPDCVSSAFLHAIQIAKAPSSRYIRAFKVSAKSSQQESSGNGKLGIAYQPPSMESDGQEAMTR